jgi:hypothetical protein
MGPMIAIDGGVGWGPRDTPGRLAWFGHATGSGGVGG